MSSATRQPRTGQLVTELHRAAAQRGKLDPVYQIVSDHFTLMLQRLFPVWALVGPGLADPAHIEIHSRNVYLDSDRLLGTRKQIAQGRMEARKVLVCFGAAFHEVLHAKHTKRWVVERHIALAASDDEALRQLGVDRALLEEPRMEATGLREFPPAAARGRFLRRALAAAVTGIIINTFAEQVAQAAAIGAPLTRDMCGRAMSYLQARTHYAIVDPPALSALHSVWTAVLGAHDTHALDDLYARVIWIPDGDNDALDRAAQRYRDIIGPPDPPPANAGNGGEGNSDGTASAQGPPDAGGENPPAGSLADALGQAIDASRRAQAAQYDNDVTLQDTIAHAQAANAAPPGKAGAGTGAPTGRMPDRGVDRPPFADEKAAAKRYATRLQRAQQVGIKHIDKRSPGGRFNARSYVRARAQAQQRQPVTSRPWEITKVVRAPIQEPHVGLVIDTSGSMSAYEYALGPIAWILSTGLHLAGGRMASGLFGNGAELLHDGAKPLALVPGIKTGGGTAFAGDAVEMVCEQLEMTNPRRPRFLYIVSDGGWYDTEAGVEKIRWLREQGVPTIHIAIGVAPLDVEADRVIVITDPADAWDLIANDTVAALRNAPGRARRG